MIKEIKDFFKRIFGIKKIKYIEEKTTKESIVNSNYSFREDINPENDEEYRIKQLQQKYKNGEIKSQDISIEDKEKIIDLYIKQINKKLIEVLEYNKKIIESKRDPNS